MTKATINWSWKCFKEFGTTELYYLLAARNEVFVVEQRCIYHDLDGLDFTAHHLCAMGDQGLVAYLRLLPPGGLHTEAAIGRVMVAAAARNGGLGRELMIKGIQGCRKYFPGQILRVSAQSHLEEFYKSLGFVTVSPAYDDDGIPHLDMLLDPGTSSEQ